MKICLSVCLCLIACASIAQTNGPQPGSAMVLTDGTEFYPTGSVPSKASVASLSSRVASVEDQAATCEDTSASAVADAQRALNTVTFVGVSNIVEITAYVGSIGSTVSTNQILKIVRFAQSGTPVTNLHFVTAFSAVQTATPFLDWRMTLSGGGTSSNDWTAVTNAVCSWPSQVTDALTPSGYYAYSFDLPVSGMSGSAFFRVVAGTGGGAGTGWYLLIYNFLSVNGRKGRTVTVVDDNANTLEFIGGPLVEPLE